MNEQRLRDELRQTPIDDGARARALGVVRAAYLEREPVRRRRRWSPALVAAACLLAAVIVAGSVTEPGDAVARWVREVLGAGREDARPALVRVPGGGRVLATVEGGPPVAGGGAWVISADGSRRRLGDYDGASWSPQGRFVVAWRGGELLAVEPGGRVRWSLARRGRIAAARWSPMPGWRIAYLSGGSLRIVNGDGTGDRRFGAASTDAAPAWRPDDRHVLAYLDRARRVRVVAVDSGRLLWRSGPVAATELAWSPRGDRLLVGTSRGWRVLRRDGRLLSRGSVPERFAVTDVAWSPRGHRIVVVRWNGERSEVVLGERLLFTGPGRLGRVAFSPGGGRLLVPWPDADQWLFVSTERGVRVSAVANIARQFARGPRRGQFPDAVEWCCTG